MTRPFVKWAGGKAQLMHMLRQMMPSKYNTYHEPFLGGGALLFDLLRREPGRACNVSDSNKELIQAYLAIRDELEPLVDRLHEHAEAYHSDPKRYYYEVRAQEPHTRVDIAARLIFLNKTCYNGLYRVNSKGKFNVPLGSYVNPQILVEENLKAVSRVLNSSRATIRCRDFWGVVDDAVAGDMVYFDPPYQPLDSEYNFTRYTARDFRYEDLKRLADACKRLHQAGCNVMLSNSHSDKVAEMFNDGDWHVVEMAAMRSINSVGSGRRGHKEFVITNYKTSRL